MRDTIAIPSSDVIRRATIVIVNVAYISNVNVMKVGLEILLLVFRTSRILLLKLD